MKALRTPVYPHYFADPFVLWHQDRYFAYGTGGNHTNGRVIEVLSSPDLQHWQSLGGSLEAPSHDALDYWAPEVAQHQGLFYMYYSAGIGDKGHALRVASASHPQGPFTDIGLNLSPHEPFAIDPHPFQDDDGQWYLFYAKDFLDGQRVGTALVADKMHSMSQLEGQPHTVLRANSDWQIYQRGRKMYGKVYDWHTLEGPFVVKRGGLYYCFYSGGNWQNPTYGVSYAVAKHPLGPWQEPHMGRAAVLQTIPQHLIGPGHNSLVRGPDGHDYLVYHAWDSNKTARQMYVSRLEWTANGPRVLENL